MSPKILCFAGSLRKGSYNKKLLKIAVEGIKEAGGETTLIDLADYQLPLYNQDDEDKNGLPANAIALKKLMKENQGLLIVSPEYNSSIPAVLKNTIDWISRPHPDEKVYLEPFMNKIAMIMSASPGNLGGLRGLVPLRLLLENIHVVVLPHQISIPQADKAFDEKGELVDKGKQSDVKKLGKELVDFLKTRATVHK